MHRQLVHRLLVNTALVANTARQQTAEPTASCSARAGRVGAVVIQQLDLADELWWGVTELPQELSALDQPFVGIQDEMPVRCRKVEGGIAGGGEVVGPGEL